jgi:hypothetical protein
MQTRSNNKNLKRPVDDSSSKGKEALDDIESNPELEVDDNDFFRLLEP